MHPYRDFICKLNDKEREKGRRKRGDHSSGSAASVNPAIPKRFTLRAFRRVCGSARVCIFRNISVPSIPRILDVPSG